MEKNPVTRVYVLTWSDWRERSAPDEDFPVEGVFATPELAQRHAQWVNHDGGADDPAPIEFKQYPGMHHGPGEIDPTLRTWHGGDPHSDVVWVITEHQLQEE